MPRLKQMRRKDIHPAAEPIFQRLFGDRDPATHPGTATGTSGNWWTVFANSPDTLDTAAATFQYCRAPTRKISLQLLELGKTRAGWARGAKFVFSQHCKASRRVGLSEEKIAALPHWQIADCYSPVERAVLAYTDALVLMGGRVADGIFDALKAHLSDEEILELTFVTMLYEKHATISRALRLEYDDVPEHVVEVAAPAGYTGDVMNMVDAKKS